ncbi:MAG: hypothetical protein O2798_02800 [Chloroflexi bacterium]|nr:hypothetical protein [Chloroflexota bacterium]MDA1239752.1 hypothetical protein [Chloroflexota bacterium]MQC25783.1 hypothetical protein [Chloroflexota bacterium]MQC47677.1 hypothetical protein [Chloroflexota bacterium]
MVATPRPQLPLLLAGDDEADLERVGDAFDGVSMRVVHARGLALACAALRGADYSVVVADVATLEEAMVILRAAGRTRPAIPVVTLLPADLGAQRPVELVEVVQRTSFATRSHPVTDEELLAMVNAALRAPRLIGGREQARDEGSAHRKVA